MKLCLQLSLHYRHKYPKAAIPTMLLKRLERMYDRILCGGLTYHDCLTPLQQKTKRGRLKRRTGHNLLLRLQNYRADVLRFLDDAQIPFTNNLAERDLRMMKCKQKISGTSALGFW